MFSGVKQSRAVSEMSKTFITVVAKQGANLSRGVAMVNDQPSILRRLAANRTLARLLLMHILILLNRYRVGRHNYRIGVLPFQFLCVISLRPLENMDDAFGRLSPRFYLLTLLSLALRRCEPSQMGFISTLLTARHTTDFSVLGSAKLGERLNLLAGGTRLFGYNVLSHGVNLRHRFTKWRGSLECFQHSCGPFCILA